MKVKFYCDNNTVDGSKKIETIDTLAYLGLTDAEWVRLSHQEKMNEVSDWMSNFLDYGYLEE
jgi:hypothetical protein